MLWITSSWVNSHGEPVSFTTGGEDADEVFRAHVESYEYHYRGADPKLRPMSIPIHDGEEHGRIEQTIYGTRDGVTHGIFARRFTPKEDHEIAHVRSVFSQRVRDSLSAGRTEDAIAAQREMDTKIVRARGAQGRKAVTLMLARFPQWSRWHEADEVAGIVRSDAPVTGC